MAKKFDTNQLDADFPTAVLEASRKAEPEFKTEAASRSPYRTAELFDEPGSITEDETRRFRQEDFSGYSFGGPMATTALYNPPTATDFGLADNRKESKTGVPEKWLIGLPYLPFSIGLVAGLVQLFLIPKHETKVRFHAAQGLAAHLGILLVTTILGVADNATDLADLAAFIFTLVTTIMLIIFSVRAWKGKPVHIESVEALTNWLEEKIGPLKS